MTFGLTSGEREILERFLIRPLKAEGVMIWIFGSRARGDHKRFSDIDVLYAVPDGVDLRPGLISEIKEALEESNLPYKVDLVHEPELAESYRASVRKDRIAV